MKVFYKELLFYTTLAVGISLFAAGFTPLFKLASSHLPLPGLHEALGASQ